MFEISMATLGAIILKLLWTSLSGVVLALFVLWPIGDKPTSTEQKTCFVVLWALAIAVIFNFISFTT